MSDAVEAISDHKACSTAERWAKVKVKVAALQKFINITKKSNRLLKKRSSHAGKEDAPELEKKLHVEGENNQDADKEFDFVERENNENTVLADNIQDQIEGQEVIATQKGNDHDVEQVESNQEQQGIVAQEGSKFQEQKENQDKGLENPTNERQEDGKKSEEENENKKEEEDDWESDEEDEDDNEDEEENEDEEDDEDEDEQEQEPELREDLFVNEAIIETVSENEKKDSIESTFGLNFSLSEGILTIKMCDRVYKFDLENEKVKQNQILLDVVDSLSDIPDLVAAKQKRQMPELSAITQHSQLTALEYFLRKELFEINNAPTDNSGEKEQKKAQIWEEEICCICQCELFSDISAVSKDELIKQLQTDSDEDPINLSHCEAHFFHRGCLRQMLAASPSYIKCPVCSQIYGVMIGDQPPGKMSIYIDKHSKCEGYEKYATITIEMHFNSTQKNGQYVPSTARVGYLPNSPEGRTVLEMLKIAFKRRLLFTIGRSVTTGKDNRIIWNGVHFKTNLYGGKIIIYFENCGIGSSANFGYPDPTYLQRVTQELSFKGIYPAI